MIQIVSAAVREIAITMINLSRGVSYISTRLIIPKLFQVAKVLVVALAATVSIPFLSLLIIVLRIQVVDGRVIVTMTVIIRRASIFSFVMLVKLCQDVSIQVWVRQVGSEEYPNWSMEYDQR